MLQVNAPLVAADSGPAAAGRRWRFIGGRCGEAESGLRITQLRTCLPAGRRRDSRRSDARSPGSQAWDREFCAELMRELSTDDYSMSIIIYRLAFE